MSQLDWQRVFRGYGCRTQEEGRALRRWAKRNGASIVMDGGLPATHSFRHVAKSLAEVGITTKDGTEYLPQQVKDTCYNALTWSIIETLGLPREQTVFQRVRSAVARIFGRKTRYSRSTPSDPYLHGRLEWWTLRKVGKKPGLGTYNKRKHKQAR